MRTVILKIRELLEYEVKKSIENGCEGILLSGLDTSILTYIASKFRSNFKAFTLKFKNGKDAYYTKKLSQILNIQHYLFEIKEKELIQNLKETIKIIGVFEPIEIRNSVAIYSILKFIKELGIKGIITGDGADELFFGYDFLIKMEKNERMTYAEKMWKRMYFSSVDIGKFLDIKIFTPYLSENFKNYVMEIPDNLKIKDNIGKWILRKSYENLLPDEFIWRGKEPIEYGSGTTKLTFIFENKIEDKEFKEKKEKIRKEDGVIIRDKEHLYYYQIYKEIFGDIRKAKENEIKCRGCGSKIEYKNAFCRICGTEN